MAGGPATYQYFWYRTHIKPPKRVAGFELMMTNISSIGLTSIDLTGIEFFGSLLDLTSILVWNISRFMSDFCFEPAFVWTFVLIVYAYTEMCWTDVLTNVFKNKNKTKTFHLVCYGALLPQGLLPV